MKLYFRDNEDKKNTLNRCFFDAEHGWTSLSLGRLVDLHAEFPNDPQVEYAEALIRKDFLGQGIKAEELFVKAQRHSKDCSKTNETYLFSIFNSAKYARSVDEYRRQERIARKLAPNDPDLGLFGQINQALAKGITTQIYWPMLLPTINTMVSMVIVPHWRNWRYRPVSTIWMTNWS